MCMQKNLNRLLKFAFALSQAFEIPCDLAYFLFTFKRLLKFAFALSQELNRKPPNEI